MSKGQTNLKRYESKQKDRKTNQECVITLNQYIIIGRMYTKKFKNTPYQGLEI